MYLERKELAAFGKQRVKEIRLRSIYKFHREYFYCNP
jgi:hypothetical protein